MDPTTKRDKNVIASIDSEISFTQQIELALKDYNESLKKIDAVFLNKIIDAETPELAESWRKVYEKMIEVRKQGTFGHLEDVAALLSKIQDQAKQSMLDLIQTAYHAKAKLSNIEAARYLENDNYHHEDNRTNSKCEFRAIEKKYGIYLKEYVSQYEIASEFLTQQLMNGCSDYKICEVPPFIDLKSQEVVRGEVKIISTDPNKKELNNKISIAMQSETIHKVNEISRNDFSSERVDFIAYWSTISQTELVSMDPALLLALIAIANHFGASDIQDECYANVYSRYASVIDVDRLLNQWKEYYQIIDSSLTLSVDLVHAWFISNLDFKS